MKIETMVKHTMVATIKALRALRKKQQVVSLIFLTLPACPQEQAGS